MDVKFCIPCDIYYILGHAKANHEKSKNDVSLMKKNLKKMALRILAIDTPQEKERIGKLMKEKNLLQETVRHLKKELKEKEDEKEDLENLLMNRIDDLEVQAEKKEDALKKRISQLERENKKLLRGTVMSRKVLQIVRTTRANGEETVHVEGMNEVVQQDVEVVNID